VPARSKLPAKVLARAKALAEREASKPAPPKAAKTPAPDKKAKLVAALKRLHPMD